MFRNLRTNLLRVAAAIVALGMIAVALIWTGNWDKIVTGVESLAGQEAAETVDEFGQSSKNITDTATQYAEDTLTAVRNGDYDSIDFSAIGDVLSQLGTTRPEARIPDYDRSEQFGSPWIDVDENGCDTRNDVLARDLDNVVKDGTCTVETGILHDPYTGETIQFTRGRGTSNDVQIDHIIPLCYVWEAGAYAWSQEERITIANDQEAELIAVDGPANGSKGCDGPAEWMPPNESFHCTYVAMFTAVAVKYELTLKKADKTKIDDIATHC